MINNQINIIIILNIVLLAFCNISGNLDEPNISVDIPFGNMNSLIQLVDAAELANSHKNGDLLSLHVINTSEQTIVFPSNFGVRISTYVQDAWIDVQNNSFTGSEPHFLPTKDEYPLGLIVDTLPYVPELSSTISIRVVVIGHIDREDGEEVGAYLDVVLVP